MLFWIILAVIIAILLLPVSLVFDYKKDVASLYLYTGPIRFSLYPKAKAREKTDADSSQVRTGAGNGNRTSLPDKLSANLPLIRTILDFLGNFRKQVYVKSLMLRLVLAGSDPYDVSLQYGQTCAIISGLEPLIERAFRIKKRDIQVLCDYLGVKSSIEFHLHISIIAIRLLILVLRYGSQFMKKYHEIKLQRKGGTDHESKSSSNA